MLIVFQLVIRFHIAHAISPSFSTQTATDDGNDSRVIPLIGQPDCSNLSLSQDKKLPDIRSVSYNSDGRFLNLTMWFSSPESKNPGLDTTTYVVGLGSLPGNGTHLTTDYFLSARWASPFQNAWLMEMEQVSENDSKVVDQDFNYTELFDTSLSFFSNRTHSNHINLYLDLKKIVFPTEYFIVPMIGDMTFQKNGVCGIIDVMDRIILIPRSEFRISTSENPVYMLKGEEKTIQVRVNSSSLERANILLDSEEDIPGISISFVPQSIELEPGETAFSDLEIKADAEPKSYTVPIRSNISYPKVDLFYIGKYIFPTVQLDNIDLNKKIPLNGRDEINMQFSLNPSYLTVSIKSFSFEDWWDSYGGVIGTVLSFAGGGVTIWLLERYKRK